MAITKILNIQESDGRNPASHLKNALEYIQNPDKTEECVLVGGINCLPDTAFEQMEETKNIFQSILQVRCRISAFRFHDIQDLCNRHISSTSPNVFFISSRLLCSLSISL